MRTAGALAFGIGVVGGLLLAGASTALAQSTDPHQTKLPDHLQYHAENRRRGRMPGQVRIRVRYRKLATPWWDLLLVSKDEMQELLLDTGWYVQKFLDSNGPSYIAVLRKDQ